jgi:hypothetical protein
MTKTLIYLYAYDMLLVETNQESSWEVDYEKKVGRYSISDTPV